MTGSDPLRVALLLAVALGGASGACLRWQLGAWLPVDAPAFPWTS